MGRRKANKEHIRNIQQSGGSYYITLPIRLVRSLKWQERQKVVVRKRGKDKILIADWKK